MPPGLRPAPAALGRLLGVERWPIDGEGGLVIPNQGGWHSQIDLLADLALAPLFRWLTAICQQALTEMGWDFSLAAPSFNNAWAMVNGPGLTTRARLHPHSLFIGVGYLQVDGGGGLYCFFGSSGGAQMLCSPLLAGRGELLLGRQRRQPLAGLMLLFSPWLCHEVEPSAPSSGVRISTSFNVGQRKTEC